jgi:hypothetical protein
MKFRIIPIIFSLLSIILLLMTFGPNPSYFLLRIPQVTSLFFIWCLISSFSLLFLSLLYYRDESKLKKLQRSLSREIEAKIKVAEEKVKKLSKEMQFETGSPCTGCGRLVPEDYVYCPFCNRRLKLP